MINQINIIQIYMDLKYDWFTKKVSRLTERIWIPTCVLIKPCVIDENSDKCIKTKLFQFSQSEALVRRSLAPVKFTPLSFTKQREDEIASLKESHKSFVFSSDNQIKYLNDPKSFMENFNSLPQTHPNGQIMDDDAKKKLITVINKMTKYMEEKNVNNEKMINKLKISQKSNKTTFEKNEKNVHNAITALKMRLSFNPVQRSVLKKWLVCAKLVYDECVLMYNLSIKNSTKFPLVLGELKLIVFKKLFGDNDKGAPYDMLTYEVKTFLENLSSAKKNLENGNIEKFEMKKKDVSKNQTITVPHASTTKSGIFPNILKHQQFNAQKMKNFKFCSDAKLTYNRSQNSYTLFVPQYVKIKQLANRKPVVALDPGESIFMTYFGLDTAGKIGIDMRQKIFGIQTKIKMWQHKMDKQKKNPLNNNNENTEKSKKFIKRKRIKKIINKLYTKIKNMVNELHKKTALYLVKNYDRILIPEFQTKNMVRNKVPKSKQNANYKRLKGRLKEIWESDNPLNEKREEAREAHNNYYAIENVGKTADQIKKEMRVSMRAGRLGKNIKFTLNMLSHYKFRQYLLAKAKEYDCHVEVVTEEFTSQACTKCGTLSKNYDKHRVKKCMNAKCKLRIHRDMNGARNILLKNIGLVCDD